MPTRARGSAKLTPAARTAPRSCPGPGGGGSGRCWTCKTDGSPCLVMTTARIVRPPIGSWPCRHLGEAGEKDIAPAGTHPVGGFGHPVVVQVKAAVFQEYSG